MSIYSLLLLIISILLSADSLYRVFFTNFNMGTAVVLGITVLCWCVFIWHKPLAAFYRTLPGKIIVAIFCLGCLFYAFLIGFVAVAGGRPTVQYNEKAIIVLGAGTRHDKLTKLLQQRLDEALRCYAQNPDAVMVVTGGRGRNETRPEAEVMAEYLMENGVPRDKIIIENKSTSTEENFVFAAELLQQNGISPQQPVVFVTNHFHCYRASFYARRAGFTEVRSAHAETDMRFVSSCYLREALAVLYQWIFK